MTEMIERVARAILRAEHEYADPDACYGYNCASEFVPGGEGGETKPHAWMWFEPHARAAIEAMREPTNPMVFAAGAFTVSDFAADKYTDPAKTYRAMIDEALK